jgi:hypothetical protein
MPYPAIKPTYIILKTGTPIGIRERIPAVSTQIGSDRSHNKSLVPKNFLGLVR